MTGEAPPPPGATERFVDHALGMEWGSLAEASRIAAKAFLYDTLCVGVAGAAAPNADAVLSVVRAWGEGGGCSVLGRPGLRLPAPSAAFVNAFQIHAQEFDCVHEPAVLHPLATAVSALRAESERSGPYDGATFLAAMAAGVDVAVALGLAATAPLRFFRPATAGVFGAVAALARLRKLEREVAVDAFGYALAFASGTMQAHVEGKAALPVQVANAARAAVVAVDLATAGLKGPRRSVDGPFGYLSLYETQTDLGPIWRDLADVRRIDELSWKPFSTGRAAHGGLAAVGRLMEQGLGADGLDSLVFRAPPLVKRLVGRPAIAGMDVAYARLCLPWLAAVALTCGEVGLGDFGPERLGDPAILGLARRIRVVEDGSVDPAAFTPLIATATSRSDHTVEVVITAMPGSPTYPLTPAQQADKGRRCFDRAAMGDAHDGLLTTVQALDAAPDVALALALASPT